MKIWSLFKHGNLITGNKILLGKRRTYSSFPQYFQYISDFRSQNANSFVERGCSIYFPQFCKADISRYGYISKYFRQSLGLRSNQSRPFLFIYYFLFFFYYLFFIYLFLSFDHQGRSLQFFLVRLSFIAMSLVWSSSILLSMPSWAGRRF